MFSFVADGLTTATTVLFPIFASYKALHTSDPALLAPWLMYFVTLSLLTAVESTFEFILCWIPFYAWIRFLVHLYLILPGSQGASALYMEHIEPFLYHHERDIESFLSNTHDRLRSAGLGALTQAIEWLKVNVLGFAPERPRSPPPAGQTYAQTLMGRFSMPNARGDNLSNLVSQALNGASALYGLNAAPAQGAHSDPMASASRSATNLVPDSIRNTDDRLSYVANQRERLETLLKAFDREQDSLRSARDGGSRYVEREREPRSGLPKSRSEAEFDRIERDEVGSAAGGALPYPITPPAFDPRNSQGGWMPWNWKAGEGGPPQQQRRPGEEDPMAYGRESAPGSRGRSSGFDMGDR